MKPLILLLLCGSAGIGIYSGAARYENVRDSRYVAAHQCSLVGRQPDVHVIEFGIAFKVTGWEVYDCTNPDVAVIVNTSVPQPVKDGR